MEQVLHTLITRGTVTVNAHCADATETAAFEIDAKALNRYIEQIKLMPKVEGVTPVVDTAASSASPAFSSLPPTKKERFERTAPPSFPSCRKPSSNSFNAPTAKAGPCRKTSKATARTSPSDWLTSSASPQVIADYETRLKARIEALLKDAQINLSQVDLIREITSCAKRTDIAEETKRLTGHLDQFKDLLSASDLRPGRPHAGLCRPGNAPRDQHHRQQSPTPRSRIPPSRSRARSTASKEPAKRRIVRPQSQPSGTLLHAFGLAGFRPRGEGRPRGPASGPSAGIRDR